MGIDKITFNDIINKGRSMENAILKNNINSQFEWKRKYRTKSLPFADKILFIRELIINNIPESTLKKLYIFGSYAYGNPTKKSDIDICIIVSNKCKNVTKIYEIIGPILRKNNIFKYDLLVYRENIFRTVYNPRGIEAVIAKKGILLYG